MPRPKKTEATEVVETEGPKAAKSSGPTITYLGGARDHSVTPEVLQKGDDGRPMKRKVTREARYEFEELETLTLQRLKLPKGVPVPCSNPETLRKALVMDVCRVEGADVAKLIAGAPKRLRERLQRAGL